MSRAGRQHSCIRENLDLSGVSCFNTNSPPPYLQVYDAQAAATAANASAANATAAALNSGARNPSMGFAASGTSSSRSRPGGSSTPG